MAKKTLTGKIDQPMDPPVFKFMKPEEIDNLMRNHIHGAKQGGDETHRFKWTEPMLMLRRQVVCDLIGQGLSRRRIMEEICSRWEVGQEASYSYIKDAFEYLLQGNEEFMQYNRDKQTERLENIITEAQMAGDYRSATMAAAELNKLLGLTTTQKLTVEGTERVFHFGGEPDIGSEENNS